MILTFTDCCICLLLYSVIAVKVVKLKVDNFRIEISEILNTMGSSEKSERCGNAHAPAWIRDSALQRTLHFLSAILDHFRLELCLLDLSVFALGMTRV